MKKKAKAWWKSKVIWFNAAAGGVAFLAAGWAELSESLPLPKWLVWLGGGVVAAANIGLRFITTNEVTVKKMGDE